MKLPLIAACLVAGSTWSFAFANVSTSTSNQKTAPRTYSAQGQSALGAQNGAKPDARVQKQSPADLSAKKEGRAQARKQALSQQDSSDQKWAALQATLAAQKQAAIAQQQTLTQPGIPAGPTGTTGGGILAVGGSDDCSTPDIIAGFGSFAFDNSLATTGTQGQTEPACNFFASTAMQRDVWFQWTAPSTGTAIMSTCGLTTVDTKIAAYAGTSCPAGAALACNDDFAGCPSFTSQINFPVTAGSTYTLQIAVFPGAAGGTGTFSLAGPPPPVPLDDCSLPSTISGLGTWLYDTTGMTTSLQQGSCGVTCGQDIWYEWTSPVTGSVDFQVCGLTAYDSVIKVYAGAGCPAGAALACNDDSCGLQSKISFAATAGAVYMLQVGGYAANSGPGGISLSFTPPPPSNDSCATPTLVVGTGAFPFDNTMATTGAEGQTEALCTYYGSTANTRDIWYQWVAPFTGTCKFSLCAGSFMDSKIAAYPGAGCPLPGSALACSDDVCGLTSEVFFPVTAGNTYTLQIGTWPFGTGGAPGAVGSFDLTQQLILPLDDCSLPTVITGLGPWAFDTTGMTTSPEQSLTCTPATLDLWYQWTAPASGLCIMSLCAGTAYDSVIAVYSGAGCPLSGTALACDDDGCGTIGGPSQVQFSAVAGQQYMLQVGGWNGQFGAGMFTMNFPAPPPNDDCSTPTVIAGTGAYPFDNVVATTGSQGQSEALCTFFGSTAITRDVWFEWTAPATGCTVIDVCGSGMDSKMAVYAGTGCPTGSAIACNDDSCGLASEVRFTATAGQTYIIQLGTWPFGPGGAPGFTGNMNITQLVGGVGNDDCSAATLVVGTGVFPFDNTSATTGCEGQSEALCNIYGNTAVDNDVWFTWTAPSSGFAIFSTCGSGIDTKIAAYLGAGCPATGSAVACDDDACGGAGAWSSTAVWSCTAGTTYALQIGNYPFGAPPGAGFFSLDVVPPPGPCDDLDDSTTENLWSLGGNSDFAWLVRFGEPGVTTTVDSIENLYGLAAFPGNSPPDGSPVDILLYADGPSQDGNPSDATLLAQIPTTTSLTDTDTYVTTMLPSPISVTGYFFAGAHMYVVGGQWAASNDTGSIWTPRSWEFGDNTGGVANLANPGLSAFPPIDLQSFGGTGNFCVRVNCTTGPATYLCTPGVSGTPACPCSNPPAGADRGCDNKGATGGASITGTGLNSLATPTLTFTTANENATVGSVLIQGTVVNAGLTFGHGIRCAAGSIKRLYVKISVAGSVTMPGVGDPSIPAKSAALGNTILAGEKRWYQVYYRDTTLLLPGCPVPANQFNVTNAAEVTWNP